MRAMARRRFISLSLAACAAGIIASRAHEHDEPGGIAYGKAPRQRLDVYAPESRTRPNHPVVVYFYGGAWQSGHPAGPRGGPRALDARSGARIGRQPRTHFRDGTFLRRAYGGHGRGRSALSGRAGHV